jgi:hypothetical protein
MYCTPTLYSHTVLLHCTHTLYSYTVLTHLSSTDRERLDIIWWTMDEKCNILVEFGKQSPQIDSTVDPKDWFFIRWKDWLLHSVNGWIQVHTLCSLHSPYSLHSPHTILG